LFAVPVLPSWNAVAAGSPGNIRRSCSRSHAAAPPHSAAIAIAVPPADIRRPSPITRAATGIVPDARRTRACAGSRHANKNCCPPATCTSSSPCRVNSLHSRFRTSAWSTACSSRPAPRPAGDRSRSPPPRRGDRLLQRAPYLEPAAPTSSPRPLRGRRGRPRS
jgi:hypothetical protein